MRFPTFEIPQLSDRSTSPPGCKPRFPDNHCHSSRFLHTFPFPFARRSLRAPKSVRRKARFRCRDALAQIRCPCILPS